MPIAGDVITQSRRSVNQSSELLTHAVHDLRSKSSQTAEERLQSAALHEGDDSSQDFCTGSCPVPDTLTEAIREQQLKQACVYKHLMNISTHLHY